MTKTIYKPLDPCLPLCQDVCSVMTVPVYRTVYGDEGRQEILMGYKVIARTPFKFLKSEGFDEWEYAGDLDKAHPYYFLSEEEANYFVNLTVVDGEIRERLWVLSNTFTTRSW